MTKRYTVYALNSTEGDVINDPHKVYIFSKTVPTYTRVKSLLANLYISQGMGYKEARLLGGRDAARNGFTPKR